LLIRTDWWVWYSLIISDDCVLQNILSWSVACRILSSLTHHSAELQGHYALGKNLAEHGPQVSSHWRYIGDIGSTSVTIISLEREDSDSGSYSARWTWKLRLSNRRPIHAHALSLERTQNVTVKSLNFPNRETLITMNQFWVQVSSWHSLWHSLSGPTRLAARCSRPNAHCYPTCATNSSLLLQVRHTWLSVISGTYCLNRVTSWLGGTEYDRANRCQKPPEDLKAVMPRYAKLQQGQHRSDASGFARTCATQGSPSMLRGSRRSRLLQTLQIDGSLDQNGRVLVCLGIP